MYLKKHFSPSTLIEANKTIIFGTWESGIKINKSRYIGLFEVSGSIKKPFSIGYANIYLYWIFFSIDFARWKSVLLPHVVTQWTLGAHLNFDGAWISLKVAIYSVFLRTFAQYSYEVRSIETVPGNNFYFWLKI